MVYIYIHAKWETFFLDGMHRLKWLKLQTNLFYRPFIILCAAKICFVLFMTWIFSFHFSTLCRFRIHHIIIFVTVHFSSMTLLHATWIASPIFTYIQSALVPEICLFRRKNILFHIKVLCCIVTNLLYSDFNFQFLFYTRITQCKRMLILCVVFFSLKPSA